MVVDISNSGGDENGHLHGGKAGDQTGSEWRIRKNYNRPWKCVLRYPDEKVADKIAALSRAAALNDNIGYDQWQRGSYWAALKAAAYDPSAIKVPCEADCSAGVCANVKAVGYLLGIEKLKEVPITSTHYMREILQKAGFQVLEGEKYTAYDSEYLRRGDILLNDAHHTAVVLTDGAKAGKPEKWTKGTYKVTASALNVRDRRSTLSGKVVGCLTKGEKVELRSLKRNNKGNVWARIKGGKYGGNYVAAEFKGSKYVKKVDE